MKTSIIVLVFTVLNFSCSRDFLEHFPYIPPENKGDGLTTGTLDEVQIDTQMILKAVGRIHQGKYKEVHAILLYKENKLVLESYFPGHKYKWDGPDHHDSIVSWKWDMMHAAHSTTKSIVSLCIGIAIEKGFIESVHQSIFDYLPNHQHLKTGGRKRITIEHLLTMTSGLQWAEWNAPLSSLENDQIGIWFSGKDPVSFVLERPLVEEPGTSFTYSGGGIQVLVEILKNATGMDLNEFSGKYLFEPLGISSYEWWLIYPTGEYHGGGGLKMTPRAMIKIGAMMLNRGSWNGTQIIPEEWVEKSMHPYAGNHGIKIPGEDLGKVGYSYTWWTKEITYKGKTMHWYSANGWGGQKIIVLPELNTVMAFTGGEYTSKVQEFEIIERFILPAIL